MIIYTDRQKFNKEEPDKNDIFIIESIDNGLSRKIKYASGEIKKLNKYGYLENQFNVDDNGNILGFNDVSVGQNFGKLREKIEIEKLEYLQIKELIENFIK